MGDSPILRPHIYNNWEAGLVTENRKKTKNFSENREQTAKDWTNSKAVRMYYSINASESGNFPQISCKSALRFVHSDKGKGRAKMK